MISARRDWRWWLPWRLGLLVAVLACTGVLAAKSAYLLGYSKRMDGSGPLPMVMRGGAPVVGASGEVMLEVEVVDGTAGEVRTEQLVIDGVPESSVPGLIGVGVMLAAMRRRRRVRA